MVRSASPIVSRRCRNASALAAPAPVRQILQDRALRTVVAGTGRRIIALNYPFKPKNARILRKRRITMHGLPDHLESHRRRIELLRLEDAVEATMALSRRRRGVKMPGVSTSTIWASPSIAMPRTGKRVVCTFCVTIETLDPVSRFTSVDLPALGAPMMAAKPARWFSISVK